MGDAPEVVREVGVDDFRMASEHQRFHLDHRLLGIAPGTVGVLFWWKIGFEDRFQHQHRCCHADPIPQGRDAQRPEFAVGLRYEHSSDRIRLVGLLPERKRQFAKPPLHPIPVDVRKILTVHTRCALVGAALSIGMCQDVLTADLVVQGIEPIAGFSLRSTGITRLQRYYEPLRHPGALGLSLAGVRLVIADHALGLPVLRTFSLCTCCRHYPGAASGRTTSLIHPVVSAFPERVVGSACALSFSRFAQRSLTLRPAHSRGHQVVTRYPKASAISLPPWLLRLLPAGAVAGWGLHPLENAALSRRTPNSDIMRLDSLYP